MNFESREAVNQRQPDVSRTIAELPLIDFNDAGYLAEPLPTLASYASQWKLGRSTRGIEVLDYDLCREVMVSSKFGTGHPRLMNVIGLPEGPALHYKRNSISFHNRGDTRRKLRAPLNRTLGMKGAQRFRTDIKQVVKQTIDEIPHDQEVNLITALCDRIPSRVYCYWLNAPLEDAEFVSRTSHTVQQVHTRNPEHTKAITKAFEDLLVYVDTRIEAATKNPGDDLLSELIQATEDGQMTHDDLRNWVVKLAEANTDNSSHQIAIAVIELASRPDLWSSLREDPSLIPAALREVMRFHPRSLSTSREAMEDVVMDGVLIPKGEAVFANIGAAHWNPDHFPEPEQFNIHRPTIPAHLNFGGGSFSCIGRFAVTIEIEEVIAYLTAKYSALEIARSEFSHSPMFTSVNALDVVLKR